MSESIVNEEIGVNIAQLITFSNIENRNNKYKVVEVKHNINENGTKSEECSDIHEVLQNSKFGNIDVKTKEESEGNEEIIQIQDDKIKYKEELEIKEEPIVFIEEFYHQITHTGSTTYQRNYCDKVLSTNSDVIKNQATHTRERPYQCSQCYKAFSRNDHLKHHL
ncbi:unnamed protein product, partial [Meganyctiphanes norvegica]